MWGATRRGYLCTRIIYYFNPRSPCGERPGIYLPSWYKLYFNPRSPCGERLSADDEQQTNHGISIHAPRVGSDAGAATASKDDQHFNPRSPCGERPASRAAKRDIDTFQSTLPVWGATVCLSCQRRGHGISIHAPRVGSDRASHCAVIKEIYFNPRSPCGERPGQQRAKNPNTKFQSTLPVWGATRRTETQTGTGNISIHAPRVGSDPARSEPLTRR